MNVKHERALIALLLILSLNSCSQSSRQWEYHENRSHNSCFNSSRLILYPDVGDPPFELEIVKSSLGIRMYLNILLLEAPPHPEYNRRTTVELFIDDEALVVHPYILKGGQRLLFPDDVTELLLQALSEGKQMKIKMGYRELTVITDNFQDIYSNLQNLPVTE